MARVSFHMVALLTVTSAIMAAVSCAQTVNNIRTSKSGSSSNFSLSATPTQPLAKGILPAVVTVPNQGGGGGGMQGPTVLPATMPTLVLASAPNIKNNMQGVTNDAGGKLKEKSQTTDSTTSAVILGAPMVKKLQAKVGGIAVLIATPPCTTCGYKEWTEFGGARREEIVHVGTKAVATEPESLAFGWKECCRLCKAKGLLQGGGVDTGVLNTPCRAWVYNHEGDCFLKFFAQGDAILATTRERTSLRTDAGVLDTQCTSVSPTGPHTPAPGKTTIPTLVPMPGGVSSSLGGFGKVDPHNSDMYDGMCARKNQHAMCEHWAVQGKCVTNPKYMLETCGKSCFGVPCKPIMILTPETPEAPATLITNVTQCPKTCCVHNQKAVHKVACDAANHISLAGVKSKYDHFRGALEHQTLLVGVQTTINLTDLGLTRDWRSRWCGFSPGRNPTLDLVDYKPTVVFDSSVQAPGCVSLTDTTVKRAPKQDHWNGATLMQISPLRVGLHTFKIMLTHPSHRDDPFPLLEDLMIKVSTEHTFVVAVLAGRRQKMQQNLAQYTNYGHPDTTYAVGDTVRIAPPAFTSTSTHAGRTTSKITCLHSGEHTCSETMAYELVAARVASGRAHFMDTFMVSPNSGTVLGTFQVAARHVMTLVATNSKGQFPTFTLLSLFVTPSFRCPMF